MCQTTIPPKGHRLFGFYPTNDRPTRPELPQPRDGANAVEGEALQEYRDALQEYHDDLDTYFRYWVIRPVTRWVLVDIYEAVMNAKADILDNLGQLGGPVGGIFFEHAVHVLFWRAAGSADQQLALKQRDGGTVTFEVAKIQPFKNARDVTIESNAYYLPSKPNQAGFDSFIPGRGFFQMTIAGEHSIVPGGIEDMVAVVNQVPEWQDESVRVPFYWIVRAGKGFKAPQEGARVDTGTGKKRKRAQVVLRDRLQHIVLEVDVAPITTAASGMREALYGLA